MDLASELTAPPAGLSKSAKALWRELAPLAIAQRTLAASTVRGFYELCEQYALKAAIAGAINHAGASSAMADGMLRQYVKLAQRVDASLARFKLTAFGKPVDDAAPKASTAQNPWASVATK